MSRSISVPSIDLPPARYFDTRETIPVSASPISLIHHFPLNPIGDEAPELHFLYIYFFFSFILSIDILAPFRQLSKLVLVFDSLSDKQGMWFFFVFLTSISRRRGRQLVRTSWIEISGQPFGHEPRSIQYYRITPEKKSMKRQHIVFSDLEKLKKWIGFFFFFFEADRKFPSENRGVRLSVCEMRNRQDLSFSKLLQWWFFTHKKSVWHLKIFTFFNSFEYFDFMNICYSNISIPTRCCLVLFSVLWRCNNHTILSFFRFTIFFFQTAFVIIVPDDETEYWRIKSLRLL